MLNPGADPSTKRQQAPLVNIGKVPLMGGLGPAQPQYLALVVRKACEAICFMLLIVQTPF
jgi:hypothetical protein